MKATDHLAVFRGFPTMQHYAPACTRRSNDKREIIQYALEAWQLPIYTHRQKKKSTTQDHPMVGRS